MTIGCLLLLACAHRPAPAPDPDCPKYSIPAELPLPRALAERSVTCAASAADLLVHSAHCEGSRCAVWVPDDPKAGTCIAAGEVVLLERASIRRVHFSGVLGRDSSPPTAPTGATCTLIELLAAP